MMIGLSNHLLSIVFRFHYRSQKVIGSLGIWLFPKIGIPPNGWFIMETPIKMDDLGGTPLFLERPIFIPLDPNKNSLIFSTIFCFGCNIQVVTFVAWQNPKVFLSLEKNASFLRWHKGPMNTTPPNKGFKFPKISLVNYHWNGDPGNISSRFRLSEGLPSIPTQLSRDKDGCTPTTYVYPNGIYWVQPWDSWGLQNPLIPTSYRAYSSGFPI